MDGEYSEHTVGLIPAHAGKTNRRRRAALLSTAHPRACGENSRQVWISGGAGGSSPRMRGKPWWSGSSGYLMGLIPAHAGKTIALYGEKIAQAAHPRACGENFGQLAGDFASQGSSPRMRGKPAAGQLEAARGRLIPAHAGKTRSTGASGSGLQAHPRACGENFWGFAVVTNPVGSSPRMRGKQHRGRRSRNIRGLIPAHAGKTFDNLH